MFRFLAESGASSTGAPLFQFTVPCSIRCNRNASLFFIKGPHVYVISCLFFSIPGVTISSNWVRVEPGTQVCITINRSKEAPVKTYVTIF